VVTENIKYADEYQINILRGYRYFRVAFMVTSELRLKSDSFFLGQKRSEMDILARILVEVVKGTRRTHILHKYDLSYRQLRVYLKFLYDLGFLMFSAKSEDFKLKNFVTSPKGLEFLEAYRFLKSLMS
jgi:predicted transcriptional regulator